MEKLFTIYKITSPDSDRFYIGITCRDLRVRFNEHYRPYRRVDQKTFLSKWLGKYGPTAKIEPLMTGLTKEQALDIECHAVEYGFRFCPDKIINTASGGGMPPNHKGKKLSKEHCLKISAAIKGRVFSEEWRAKLSYSARHRRKKRPI